MADTSPAVRCLFCKSEEVAFWHVHRSKADGREYKINRCSECQSAFVFPPPSDQYLEKFYSQQPTSSGEDDTETAYSKMLANEIAFPNGSVDALRLIKQARELARGNKFLDIGAGTGYFTKAAVEFGFDCTALEIGGQASNVFEMLNGFKPTRVMFDDSFVADHKEEFDVVLLSQVLEHMTRPANVAQNILRCLRPGGLCVVAIPHFGSYLSKIQRKGDMFISPPEHVNFISTLGLRKLFESCGYECVKTYTVSRYDRNRVTSRLKNQWLSGFANAVLPRFMNFSDTRGKGMFINAFFVK